MYKITKGKDEQCIHKIKTSKNDEYVNVVVKPEIDEYYYPEYEDTMTRRDVLELIYDIVYERVQSVDKIKSIKKALRAVGFLYNDR